MTDEIIIVREVLADLRIQAKRNFIIIITLIVMLFATSAAWLYYYSLPDYETYETYELDGEDSSNVVYNSQGNVKINDTENE